MTKEKKDHFSEPLLVFHERRLPEKATPVGYAALFEEYKLSAPLPKKLFAIGSRHKVCEENNWHILTPRHMPASSLAGHLVFALKYEGLDLTLLKRLFEAVPKKEIENIIQEKPTSSYMRRIWFLYEWLLDTPLDLPDSPLSTYVDVVDTKHQFAVRGVTSLRHRVRNNLPGTRNFCPLVFCTKKIEGYIESRLSKRVRHVIGNISSSVLGRAAAFLLLKDSKSSYAIEGESPPQNRIQRWGHAIGEAGKQHLDADELLRLQRIVIGKSRFIKLGMRNDGGFVGEHERESRLPLPEHISARPMDISILIQGMLDFNEIFAGELDPVVAAAILSFGFVYVHPFEDGNGRLHRYLIHHVLTQRGFNPPGVVFPVSSVFLERIEDYRRVLESYSKKILPLIDWRPTETMNIQVLNDTCDFYRYFDATTHVEFLYECVEQAIEIDLPQEVEFLKSYDSFKRKIEDLIEMLSSMINLLYNFLKQGNGILSQCALNKEFSALNKQEVILIEKIYADAFL